LGLPLIGWLYLAFAGWLDGCYFKYLHRMLRRSMKDRPQTTMVCPTQEAEEDGIFVGLLPRGSVSPEDGFYAWDIGFLWLSPDCLVYQGERAAFSLSREMMNGISIQKGPLAWRRTYGVMISCANGSIGFSTPDRWASRWNARKLRKR